MIDTLPLVWQVDVVPESWQLGRASAAGAETPATTAKLTINSADLHADTAEPVEEAGVCWILESELPATADRR